MNVATQASTEAQVTEKKGNSESFKAKYEETLTAQNVQAGARNLAEDVLTILLNQRVPAGFGDINGQIAEAAKRGDVDSVLELSQKLKNLKDNETANVKALADLKKKHTFADVLQAFSAEFEELAYNVSHRTITATHAIKEYSIEPGFIELKDGNNVMVSRTNMIEAIEKQTAAMFDGWKAEKVQIN